MLNYLLQDMERGSMYSVEAREEYCCAGIYSADNKRFVAFDNYTRECFVEEFDTFKEAVRWIRYEDKPAAELLFNADSGDLLHVYLSPDKTPNAFQKKVKCLMSSG